MLAQIIIFNNEGRCRKTFDRVARRQESRAVVTSVHQEIDDAKLPTFRNKLNRNYQECDKE